MLCDQLINRGRFLQIGVLMLALGGLALQTQGAWTGAGTAGGDPAATNFNDTANWTDGMLDNNFITVVSDVTLQLTADHSITNGLNFVEQDKNLAARHIVVNGTNTLILNGDVPGYASNRVRQLFIPSNTLSTVTLGKGLVISMPSSRTVTGNGILFVDAKLTGNGGFLSGYVGGHSPVIFLRNDANDFTGDVGGDQGRLHFTSLADKGLPSALGAGNSISLNNNSHVYIGGRSQKTNRGYTMGNNYAALYNDSGCGALSLTGTFASGRAPSTNLTLGGLSEGETLIAGDIANFDPVYYTRLSKQGSGTLRLTGLNTFTGLTNYAYAVSLFGGTLIADHTNDVSGAGNNRLFLAGRNVEYSDGRLVILGKSGAGNTTGQEFGTNSVVNNSLNVLVAAGNGGDGTTVTLQALVIPDANTLFRMERNGVAAITATNALPSDAGTVRTINGMVMSNSGQRSNVLVKDPDGRVGFAAQNETFEFVRHANTLALVEDNAEKTDHVALAADLTRTTDLNFSTLAIDASANAVTLDLGAYTLQSDSTAVGRGILINGNHPVSIKNGAHGANSTTYLHNYGTGKLSWELANNNSASILVSAGPGLTEITQGLYNSLYVVEGVTRLTYERPYHEGTIYIYGGGVLEIGADLDDAGGSTSFGRTVGTGSHQICFLSGGGLSAYGANRTVNLGGSGTTTLNWSSGGFLADGKPFILSSPYADSTLTVLNPISLNNRIREVRVQNGSAAIDASLAGRISSTFPMAGLVKSGAGTLELTGKQEYYGDVSVIAGGLRLGANDIYAGGTNALLLSNATLDAGTARNTFDTLELLADSVIEAGGSTALAFANSRDKIWAGTLTVNGTLNATALRFGTDSNGLTAAQIAAITNRGRPVALDEQGYLRQIPGGTVLLIQ